jgi:ChrR Cupin-like domain
MDSEASVKQPTLKLIDLFHLADRLGEIPWVPYKEKVEIFRLYENGITGPTAALLRYSEGGEVPLHEHDGYEHILVLAGSQSDRAKLGSHPCERERPPVPAIWNSAGDFLLLLLWLWGLAPLTDANHWFFGSLIISAVVCGLLFRKKFAAFQKELGSELASALLTSDTYLGNGDLRKTWEWNTVA